MHSNVNFGLIEVHVSDATKITSTEQKDCECEILNKRDINKP